MNLDQIKFRGKTIMHQNWVTGHFFFWKRYGVNIPIIGEGVQNGSVQGHKVMPETIGRFTGKLDKNGKEIYEGDIFRETIEEDHGDNVYYYIVTWIEEWTMFAALSVEERDSYLSDGARVLDRTDYWTFPLDNAEKQTVIGNIYEHRHKIQGVTS